MLHRSFKPAKCKTALKLAASRIKLLKNKREAQVKHMKRELAQLLESGQERTAMIRAEHVVREEKTLSAYELIEIYCELIVARLPIIESQKNCPIDLKEAITSIIFASPRCADVPELMDARKHFTAKYGKEFASAAVEMRPNCGVARMLIEKLSAIAPDGPTKIKILKTIAEEHNIKWDPIGEKDPMPPEDLLNGPSTFEKASIQMRMEPPNVQVQSNYDQKGQSTFQVPSSREERHDIPTNLHDRNLKSAHDSQNSAPAYTGNSHPEARPPGIVNEGMEFRHSYSGNGSNFSSGRQNWNMEFKDAAAAAQAAAESADRASMAARAAAELSSRENMTRQYSSESRRSSHENITRQYSSESRNSSLYGVKGDQPERYSGSRFEGEHLAKDQANNAFHGRVSKMQSERVNENEHTNLAGGVDERFYEHSSRCTNTSSRSSSLKSHSSSFHDDHVVNSSQMADKYSENNSTEPGRSDLIDRKSFNKQSSNSGFTSLSGKQDDMTYENIDYSAEVRLSNQSSRTSSHSHSRDFSKDNEAALDPNKDAGENPFSVIDDGSIQSDTKQTSSHNEASLVFDESGSDDDEDVFDAVGKYKEHESSLFFSPPDRKSPTNLTTNINAWSPRRDVSHSVFSAGSAVSSRSNDRLPVTFDDSDGPSSESEEDVDRSNHVGRIEPRTFVSKHDVPSSSPYQTKSGSQSFLKSSSVGKGSGSDRKLLSQSLSSDFNSREVHFYGKQGVESSGTKFVEKFGSSGSPSKLEKSLVVSDDDDSDSLNDPVIEGNSRWAQQLSRPSLVHEEGKNSFRASQLPDRTIRDTEVVEESSLESGSELNLGMLTGGLRNKGFKRPPYSKNLSGNAFLPKQAVDDTSSRIEQSSSSPRLETSFKDGVSGQEAYNQNTKTEVYCKSSSISSQAHLDHDSDEEFQQKHRPHNYSNMTVEVNKKSSLRSPTTYFDSDNSDSEDNLPRQTPTSKGRSGTGFSRRTKASPDSRSLSKAKVLSGGQVTSDRDAERTDILAEPHFETKSSYHVGDLEWARKVAQSPSRTIPDSNKPSREESLKSASRNLSSNSRPKIVLSSTSGNSKSFSSSATDSPSKEKPSHVHPNLPDIDTFTAHFQALRNNRR